MTDHDPPDGRLITPFARATTDLPAVAGMLHRPVLAPRAGLVLTHGAGADIDAPVLVTVTGTFVDAGIAVLRCALPFRQARGHGPPRPGDAALDRLGLRHAVLALRGALGAPVALGGHSYGGRQATLLAADEPGLADALLLLSYPLHPPRRAHELRTAHFPRLTTPAVFVHGSRDPFGSLGEVQAALALIPAVTRLLAVDGAGHDLGARGHRRRAGPGDRDAPSRGGGVSAPLRGAPDGAPSLVDVGRDACASLSELAGWPPRACRYGSSM
jgi:uncharacterized protein